MYRNISASWKKNYPFAPIHILAWVNKFKIQICYAPAKFKQGARLWLSFFELRKRRKKTHHDIWNSHNSSFYIHLFEFGSIWWEMIFSFLLPWPSLVIQSKNLLLIAGIRYSLISTRFTSVTAVVATFVPIFLVGLLFLSFSLTHTNIFIFSLVALNTQMQNFFISSKRRLLPICLIFVFVCNVWWRHYYNININSFCLLALPQFFLDLWSQNA